MASAEKVLTLFDSYWFEYVIFTKKPPLQPHETNPVHQIHEELEELEEPNKLSRLPTLHVRSQSDQFFFSNASFTSDPQSPDSVLLTPKLETILSGKEESEIFIPVPKHEMIIEIPIQKKVSGMRRRRRRRRLNSSSKSLSALEFEEVKGFMDLGFVFSEEDKDSSLVSIIPGLQRLGRKSDEEGDGKDEGIDESVVSRPYLSEAWDVLDHREVEKPLMNWRIPALGNKEDMKDQLRFWAHTVASTVR